MGFWGFGDSRLLGHQRSRHAGYENACQRAEEDGERKGRDTEAAREQTAGQRGRSTGGELHHDPKYTAPALRAGATRLLLRRDGLHLHRHTLPSSTKAISSGSTETTSSIGPALVTLHCLAFFYFFHVDGQRVIALRATYGHIKPPEFLLLRPATTPAH